MSFQKNVDEKIKEAIARGEFDNLPGKGKPLNLDDYFATPEHLRGAYSILKGADVVPEEVLLLKEIENLKVSLGDSANEDEIKNIRKKISDKTTKFNLMMEQYRRDR